MDLDSFFASVEVLKDPSLKGKPVIVGGYSARSVVASCNYEARAFGVRSAMPVYKAKNLCPDAIFLRADMESYSRYSAWVTLIIRENVPLFEKASVDEFYCDLSGMEKYFGSWKFAQQLRQKIIQETGLPISMCLASSKTTAKIGTGFAKPNGELLIEEGTEKAFLAPLSIAKLPMAGEQIVETLQKRGVKTVGELAAIDPALLENLLGKIGRVLWHKANGTHFTAIEPFHERKSISTERTFEEDSLDALMMETMLKGMTEKLCYSIRRDGVLTNCIAVKLRFQDFKTVSKQISIAASDDEKILIPIVLDLFKAQYAQPQPIRLIGVRFSGLGDQEVQGNLFVDVQKDTALHQSVDKIREKYGLKKLMRAGSITPTKKK